MKIAIPVFNSRISPRFDCAQELLLVNIAEGQVMAQEKISTQDLSSLEKIRTILSLGVDTLICGGIDCHSMRRLEHHGLPVHAWLTGDVQDILSCFLSGKLASRIGMAPAGHRHLRRRFMRGKRNFNMERR